MRKLAKWIRFVAICSVIILYMIGKLIRFGIICAIVMLIAKYIFC